MNRARLVNLQSGPQRFTVAMRVKKTSRLPI